MNLGAYVIDRRPLTVPAFRRLWVAGAVSAIGGSFSLIAVPTQLFNLTGSSVFIGVSAVVSMCALIGSALWVGALADAMDRRRLLLAGNVGLGGTYLGLWLNTVLGFNSVPVLLVLVAAQGVSLGATMTTTGAAMPPRPGAHTKVRLTDGFRYLARHRILVALLAVDLAAMVFAMPVALFPELADDTYGGPAGGGVELGLLFAAYPAGVLLAGLLSGTFSTANRHGRLMAASAMVWGGCVVLLGLAAHLWTALVALTAGGAVNFVLSTFRNAISQAYTDDALRGRIQGALTVVLIGGPQLANVVHGLAAGVLGVRWTIGIGGALTVLSVVLLVRAVPQLWRYAAAAS